MLLTGNRTLCHSIWSVIKQVIKQIRLGYTVIRYLLITPLITDRKWSPISPITMTKLYWVIPEKIHNP